MRHRLPAPHVRSKYNFKVKFRVETDNNFLEKKVGRVGRVGKRTKTWMRSLAAY